MLSTNMNGGMKMISEDGRRVLVHGQDDIEMASFFLERLKNAEKVEIVSTGSTYSLIVRVKLSASHSVLFRDDLIGEDDALMARDERMLPTTGKPITDVILKFILVAPTMTRYTYDTRNDKCTMGQVDVNYEYTQQQFAFDATNVHFPLCPDVVANVLFPSREKFDEIFTKPTNKQYIECRVFQKLRTYFSLPFKPQVAMIAMESIPETYVTLKTFGISLELTAQVCAMYVVLFHMCKLIGLDAHLSNWLVDTRKPEPLRFKLIDFGMCVSVTGDDKISKIVFDYFKTRPMQLPAYFKLMGAKEDESPSDVMNRAIMSVYVPDSPVISWIHRILVISMLVDGFFNVAHSSTKITCQMSNVFNLIYDNACVSMEHMLQTMSLDLTTYLRSQPAENAERTVRLLNNMSSYMERYYMLRPRNLHHSDDVSDAAKDMPAVLSRYDGGRKLKPSKTKRKSNKSKKKNHRGQRVMHVRI